MKKNIEKHLVHYLFLIAILVVGFGSFFLASYDKTLQVKIIFLISASYFFWGMIHHFLKDDLNLKIMIEYLLISALAFLVLFSLIGRA
jgi:hypothetical protein